MARIEAAVAAGETDLRKLGFWRLVERIKRDPAATAHLASRVSAIDEAAFLHLGFVRIPIWLGNLAQVAGLVLTVAIVVAARTLPPTPAGVLLVGAAGLLMLVSHTPTHWLVGRLFGIRFSCYYLNAAIRPPRPGVKIEYASYLRASPRARALMHASGAVASKLAPLVVLVGAVGSGAPWWAFAGLLALTLVTIATDVIASTKTSDWKRVRRELRVARALKRVGRSYTGGEGSPDDPAT